MSWTSRAASSSGGMREEVLHLDAGHPEPARRHEHEATQAVLLLDREPRAEHPPSENPTRFTPWVKPSWSNSST